MKIFTDNTTPTILNKLHCITSVYEMYEQGYNTIYRNVFNYADL